MVLKGNEKVAEYEDNKICIKSTDILQKEKATKRFPRVCFSESVLFLECHQSLSTLPFFHTHSVFFTVASSSWKC